MENLTPDQLTTTVTVLLALFAVLLTVDKVIDVIKKWSAPSSDTAKKLAWDKDRLDEHEASIKMLQESSRVQCSALLALLDHELHNGNADQMEDARKGVLDYLQGLVTK